MDDPVVEIRLSEIQRIRDAVQRLPERHTSNLVRHLLLQLIELHSNLQKQAKQASHSQP